MISDQISISDLASLLIAISLLMGVALASIVVMRIINQQRLVSESLKSIEDRNFYSANDEWRMRLERQIADLNERLTDQVTEFKQVNHLLYDAENSSVLVSEPSYQVRTPFLDAMNIPNFEVEEDLIFVLTPFDKREGTTYAAIVEAFESWDVTVSRGDEEKVESNLLRYIISYMMRSNIIIANVATRNPNVMYELGIAQALGKRVIMISRTIEAVPFDLRNQRILLYKTRQDLISKLRESVGSILFASKF